MRVFNLRNAAIALAAGIGLSGCTAYGPYGGLGVGVGYNNGYGAYGYDPYYSNYGYGSYAGYGSYGGYGSYRGYGYGSPWGWYDNFYYPGTGYYVYDQYRRPYRWSDSQRRYWERRREYYRSRSGTGATAVTTVTTPQWGDFSNRDRVRVRTNTDRIRVRNGDTDRVRVRTSENDRVRVRSVRPERQSTTTSSDDDGQSNRGRRNGHWRTKKD